MDIKRETPEEVISAPEHCTSDKYRGCDGCPYHIRETDECGGDCVADALARLKAARNEIQRLRKTIRDLCGSRDAIISGAYGDLSNMEKEVTQA